MNRDTFFKCLLFFQGINRYICMMNKENIQDEIERTWLMRKMPDMPDDKWTDVIYIQQFYVEHEGRSCRLRYSYDAKGNALCDAGLQGRLLACELIWKERVGVGHNKEHHLSIGENEAEELKHKATRAIDKVRWVYEYNGLRFEIDCFESAVLVKLEVEVPTMDTIVIMPEFIEKNIICELTGVPGFDNYHIATKEIAEWLR